MPISNKYKKIFVNAIQTDKVLNERGNTGNTGNTGNRCSKRAQNFLNKLNSLELQVLKMKLLDRARTNYDSEWQREYFFGDMKQKSKTDIKYINELFQKYGNTGIARVSEDELVQCFVGDAKKYFSGMTPYIKSK